MNTLPMIKKSAELSSLIQRIRSKEDVYSDDLEKSYEDLLNFLVDEAEARGTISQWLMEQVKAIRSGREGGGLLSVDAIAYCMHELRWPEILNVAQAEHENFYSLKMDNTLLPLIDSYSNEWSDAEVYARHSKH